jgi:Glycosyl hydrolase family 12
MVPRIVYAALWSLLWMLLNLLLIAAPPADATTCSVNGCSLDMSSSTYVLNNEWNLGSATGSQSVSVNSPTSWSTSWDWNRAEEWTVTTYGSAITGWQWGWHIPQAQTGLPIQIASGTPINASVAFDHVPDPSCGVSRTCRYDIAYDVWIHDSSNPGTTNPIFEMMIWLAYERNLTVGQPVAGYATIGGHQWKVLVQGSYAAFVINEPADLTAADLNITEFAQWLVTNQGKPSSWWITSVQFGPEAYKGKATLNVTSYSVSVGSGGSSVSPTQGTTSVGSEGSLVSPPQDTPLTMSVGTTTVSPSQVASGQNAAITTQVTSSAAASGINVDLEIYDTDTGALVAQRILGGQSFVAGETRPFTWTWPATTTGPLTVKVGIFSGDWSSLYTWNNAAAQFDVGGDPPAYTVTWTNASPDPVKRGSTATITTKVKGGVAETGVRLNIEVFTPTGEKVGQKICKKAFVAGQTNGCTYRYTVRRNAPTGVYRVGVGVLNGDSTLLHTWVDTADSFRVK